MPQPASTPVLLDIDEVSFQYAGKDWRFPCEIVLDTAPHPSLFINLKEPGEWLTLALRGTLSTHLLRANITCEVFVTESNADMVRLKPCREPLVFPRTEQLVEVQFDILNFLHFSTPVFAGEDTQDINVGGWHIEIRPPRESASPEAFRSSFYSLTHSCVLRKANSGTFNSDDVHTLLIALHDTMSFATGRWVAPVFVRGLRSDGNTLWKEWGTRRLHPYLGRVDTWFDVRNGHVLGEIMPGILEIRKAPERRESWNAALYWYIRSTLSSAGPDGGLILAQAALELLSWQYFVQERKALSPDGFERLPADDQIRLLVKALGIPTEIPAGLGELLAKARERNWSDGPKAVAFVRNRLVHPMPRKGLPYYDAWRLAEWYLELVMLRTIGFTGDYSNRTKAERWVGAVERVPWVKT